MQIVTAETMVRWEIAVRHPDGHLKTSSRHSTFEGMLVCKEDLARTRPDFVPKLTRRGRARLTVLSLCDGSRPLAEVEEEVYQRHPDLFEAYGDAAAVRRRGRHPLHGLTAGPPCRATPSPA